MFRTVRALMLKEWIQTFRDKRMLVIIFVVPLLQMMLFGVAVNNEVRNYPVFVADQDRTAASREIISALQRGGYFRIVGVTSDSREAEASLYMNRARIALVIPPDLTGRLRSGRRTEVQILLDGSDSNSATVAMGYIIRILNELNTGRQIVAVPPGIPALGTIDPESRVFYNPSLISSHFMVPAIITMILTVIATMLTAMGITKEKERGTFEQLVVSPIRGWELMLGKTLPFAVIAFFDAALATSVGVILFGIPLEGPVWVLSLLNACYVMAMLGMGLFVSTVSESQQQAMMTVFAIVFPFIILSGFFFPIENMPIGIQYLTLLNPMRYCLVAQRSIFLKGSGWSEVWHNIVILLGFAVAFLSYGTLRFRRSLSL